MASSSGSKSSSSGGSDSFRYKTRRRRGARGRNRDSLTCCYCLPRPRIRFLIVALLCLGSFSASLSRTVMSATILAMAPQRPHFNHTGGAGRHNQTDHHPHTNTSHSGGFFQAPFDQRIVPWAAINDHSKTSHMSDDDSFACDPDAQPEPLFGHALNGSRLDRLNNPEFDWSDSRQDFLLGAFGLGYVVALVPASRLAESYRARGGARGIGARRLAALGGVAHLVLNVCAPLLARRSYWALFLDRIVVGVAHAAIIPTFFTIISTWVPDNEKSKAIAAISVSGSLGTIFNNLISGYLCQWGWDGGWPSVFYLTAAFNAIWLVIWWMVVAGTPRAHRWPTRREIAYIEANIASSSHHPPKMGWSLWFEILLSPPVLATIYVKLTYAWFFTLLQSKMSSYIIGVLNMDLEQTTIYNTVYNSILLLSIVLSGVLSDYVITNRATRPWCRCCKECSVTTIRKAFDSISTFGTAACIACLPHTGCNKLAFLGILTVGVACSGANTGGSGTIIFDLTADFASTIISMATIVVQIVCLIAPTLMTQLINRFGLARLHHQWEVLFYLSAIVLCTGGLVFCLYGSAARQPWSSKGCSFHESQYRLQASELAAAAINQPSQPEVPVVSSSDSGGSSQPSADEKDENVVGDDEKKKKDEEEPKETEAEEEEDSTLDDDEDTSISVTRVGSNESVDRNIYGDPI